MAKKFEHSSGNVFADLNLPNPEKALAKAELARQIHRVIKKKRLTQSRAALALGIDQPKISALVSGKLAGFSLERLFRFLNELGQDVTIDVKPKSHLSKKAVLKIAEQNPDLPHKFIKDILIAQQDIQAGKIKPYPLTKRKV